jgi:hypothetical protein
MISIAPTILLNCFGLYLYRADLSIDNALPAGNSTPVARLIVGLGNSHDE